MSETESESGTSGEPDAAGASPSASTAAERAPTRRRGRSSVLKRYGPFVAVAILVVGAIAIFGRGGDDEDDGGGGGGEAAVAVGDREELIRNGPMSWEKAELLGEDVDFGPNCDTETGRIKLPTVYAPPCVQPFEGDNGGETATGVTAATVKIVAYVADPTRDPLGAATLAARGIDLDPEKVRQTIQDYLDVYNVLFETYGRRVEVEFFNGSGSADDQEAARADAIAIAEKEPFAVVGAPLLAGTAFADELTANGILVWSAAQNDSFLEERAPELWTAGPSTNQAARLAAEAIGKYAGPGPAELAGDEELQDQDRVYGVVHFDTPEGDQQEGYQQFVESLEEHGIEIATDVEYFLDFTRIQDTMRTAITQLKEAGVTTVIFFGDGVTPQFMTPEATAQDYFPEWILGPNALADTVIFARGYDQEQWGNGFGVAISGTPGTEEVSPPYVIYHWAYDRDAPSNIYQILEPGLRSLFLGIHMAGPDLTHASYRDGLLRLPPRGGGPTQPLSIYGNPVWEAPDYGSSEDVALMWWDPEAEGDDEIGVAGQGMYVFADGGERYTLGELPDTAEEAGLFDDGRSVTELTELPEEDQVSDYDPPQL